MDVERSEIGVERPEIGVEGNEIGVDRPEILPSTGERLVVDAEIDP
jgi:hypothetical protein